MKLRDRDLDSNPINTEHEQLGIPPLERVVTQHPLLRTMALLTALILAAIALLLVWKLFFPDNLAGGLQTVQAALKNELFWAAALAGLIAQIIDGALGMAYGITAMTFLLSTGATPLAASASVHIAEIFTTGVSGIAHVKFGNVNKGLFLRLLLPGALGTVLGALLVAHVDGAAIKPWISAYLLLMGLYVIHKAFRRRKPHSGDYRHVGKLAVVGGFADAAGGGGWGPIVTTTLLGSGHDPRTTIGSVNFAEFFLSLLSAFTFMLLVGSGVWVLVAGLVAGGLLAAPFAAWLCSRIPARVLLITVGILIGSLSLYNLLAR